ncbi:hypothetical protein TNCV_4107191 [Trichonephila clavipes]|nr:hypothetical protein TNCV_4107191 [Trichonephila clavipes]
MSNRCPSRARQLSSAGSLRVSEPLALETAQRIRNVSFRNDTSTRVKRLVRNYRNRTISRQDFARRKDFVCRAEFVSISRSKEHNRFTDFGSPPIPMRALWIANGDLFDNSLFGKEISRNLEFIDISSTLRVGKTRPLPELCKLGSISEIQTSFWRASTHHGVLQGRQCAGHLAYTRHGAYLEYTQNIVLQHQGEDPTGKPATPYLQHQPFSSVFSGTPKKGTPAD